MARQAQNRNLASIRAHRHYLGKPLIQPGNAPLSQHLCDSGTDLPAGLLIRADPAVLVDS